MNQFRKHIALVICILTCLGMLSACAGAPAVQEPAEETGTWDAPALEEQSLAYAAMLRDGDLEGFFQAAGEDLTAGCSQEDITAQWNAAAGKARTYRGKEAAAFTEQNGQGIVTVSATCARYLLNTEFDYRQDGTLCAVSFWTAPLPVEPEETDTWYEEPVTVGYDPEKQLNGLLTIPKDVEAPPVAILMQGSGANGMDSLIGASDNRPFADLAHGLAEQGIAVLRYDKRSYAYPADVVDIQTEYLYDVKDAVQLVMQDPRFSKSSLVLIGHSQGGFLGPVVLSENPEFTGFVSMAGTLRNLEDLVLEQSETMMAQNETLSQEEKDAVLDAVRADVERIKQLGADSDADASVLIQGYPETYWKSLNLFDRTALAAQSDVPMLILQGKNDFQVLYETDYMLWQEVLAEKDIVTFKAYDGLSHVFMPGSKERFEGAVYDPPAHVDQQVITDIAEWIHQL